MQPQGLAFGGGAQRVQDGFDQRGEHDRLDVETYLARDDAAHVEQVFDDLRLSARIAFDGSQAGRQVRRRGRGPLQYMRPA